MCCQTGSTKGRWARSENFSLIPHDTSQHSHQDLLPEPVLRVRAGCAGNPQDSAAASAGHVHNSPSASGEIWIQDAQGSPLTRRDIPNSCQKSIRGASLCAAACPRGSPRNRGSQIVNFPSRPKRGRVRPRSGGKRKTSIDVFSGAHKQECAAPQKSSK